MQAVGAIGRDLSRLMEKLSFLGPARGRYDAPEYEEGETFRYGDGRFQPAKFAEIDPSKVDDLEEGSLLKYNSTTKLWEPTIFAWSSWTPSVTTNVGDPDSVISTTCYYTSIGEIGFALAYLRMDTTILGAAGNIQFTAPTDWTLRLSHTWAMGQHRIGSPDVSPVFIYALNSTTWRVERTDNVNFAGSGDVRVYMQITAGLS